MTFNLILKWMIESRHQIEYQCSNSSLNFPKILIKDKLVRCNSQKNRTNCKIKKSKNAEIVLHYWLEGFQQDFVICMARHPIAVDYIKINDDIDIVKIFNK
jgi:hypothetical protein